MGPTSVSCGAIASLAVFAAGAHAQSHHASAPVHVAPSPAPVAKPGCCWCDPDTPEDKWSFKDRDGVEYELIFSDEFEQLGRNLANGKDKRWTALNESDYTNSAACRYTPDAVTTVRDTGAMVRVQPANESNNDRVWKEYAHPVHAMRITTDNITDPAFRKAVNKSFTSGMVQSWNKFCFTGGVIEARAKFTLGLGFWPAIWIFGNLGRAIYEPSNTGLWPFSMEECDEQYERQPIPGGGPKQRISGCDPNPGPGLHPYQGRGATEVDLVEVGDSYNGAHGWFMSSLQIRPAIPAYFRPKLGDLATSYPINPETGIPEFKMPKEGGDRDTWYHGLIFGGNESDIPPGLPNNHWWGPAYADSLTAGVNPFHDLSEKYRTYRVEWQDGDEDGFLRFYVEDVFIFEIPKESLGRYSVCSQGPNDKEPHCSHTPKRTFPSEPASIVMNVALGSWNGGPDSVRGNLPGHMYVDYVRVWQRPDRRNMGCDPPDHPTKEYIYANRKLYGELAEPYGDESCDPIYPPPKRGKHFHPKEKAKHHKHKTPLDSMIIGALVIGIAAVAVSVVAAATVSAYFKRRNAERASQYHEVDAASVNAPMLGKRGAKA